MPAVSAPLLADRNILPTFPPKPFLPQEQKVGQSPTFLKNCFPNPYNLFMEKIKSKKSKETSQEYSSVICSKRENWIDVLRGIAILAVIVDHSLYIFPAFWNTLVSNHTFFSVNWFIFLAAYSNCISFSLKSGSFIQKISGFYRRRSNIFLPYIVATIIYYIYLSWPSFDFKILLSKIFNFSGSYHLYFVQVIIQLYLIFPFIFIILGKIRNIYYQIILLVIITLISFKIIPLNTQPWNYQNFFAPLYIAYLPVFTASIIFFFRSQNIQKWISYIAVAIYILMEVFLFLSGGVFSVNIPNFYLSLWSITLLLTIKLAIDLTSKHKTKTGELLSYLGRKSLPIYLYHFLILKILSKSSLSQNGLFFVLSILISVILSLVIDNIYTRLKSRLV